FLGVFLAYGIVGPMASRLNAVIEHDAQFYKIIRDVLVPHLHGNAAQVSVEIGRGSVPSSLQPSFAQLEEALAAAEAGCLDSALCSLACPCGRRALACAVGPVARIALRVRGWPFALRRGVGPMTKFKLGFAAGVGAALAFGVAACGQTTTAPE